MQLFPEGSVYIANAFVRFRRAIWNDGRQTDLNEL